MPIEGIRASRRAATAAGLGVLLLAALAAPAVALNCQYQGRSDSVIRFSPGLGIVFGTFRLVNSPSACPDGSHAIQFSGAAATTSARSRRISVPRRCWSCTRGWSRSS